MTHESQPQLAQSQTPERANYSERQPLKLAVESEMILQVPDEDGFGDRVYATTATRTDGTKLSVILLTDTDIEESKERANRDARLLKENGVVSDVLPARTDDYTPEEAVFASDKLGLSRARIRHPFMPQLKEVNPDNRQVYFMEPTPKSLLDIMSLAGHSTPELQDARLAALHNKPNTIADNLAVLLRVGQGNERIVREQASSQDEAIRDVSGIAAQVPEIVQGLLADGLNSHWFKKVGRALAEGLEPPVVETIAQATPETHALVKELWLEALQVARTHNLDPAIYTEVHQVGDMFIPLPALGATAYESNGELGFVDIHSGHTLAGIYHDLFRHTSQRNTRLDDRARANRLVSLSQSLGLGTGTLVSRGYIGRQADAPLLLQRTGRQETISQLDNPQFVQEVSSLAATGIHTATAKTGYEVAEIGFHESRSVGEVHNTFTEALIAPDDNNRTDDPSMVLTGLKREVARTVQEDVQGMFIQEAQDLVLDWHEGPARSHNVLYAAAGHEPNAQFALDLQGIRVFLAGRFNMEGPPSDRFAKLRLFLGANPDVINSIGGDLRKIVTNVENDINRHMQHDMGMPGKKVQTEVLIREGPDREWQQVQLQS
jgi:hypothetical protein